MAQSGWYTENGTADEKLRAMDFQRQPKPVSSGHWMYRHPSGEVAFTDHQGMKQVPKEVVLAAIRAK